MVRRASSSPGGRQGPKRWPRRAAVHLPAGVVLLVGLLLTGLLASASNGSYQRSERTLTGLQTRLSALVLQGASADIRRRLAPAALLAAHGDPGSFAAEVGPSIGAKGPFVGADLFELGPVAHLVASVGAPLEAPPPLGSTMAAIGRAGAAQNVAVTHLVGPGYQRLGYSVTAGGPAGDYAVYAEQALPADRRVSIDPASPADNLYVAVYFGSVQTPQSLIETNAPHLPFRGVHAVESFPFGVSTLSLAVSPKASLVDGFAASQTTIIAAGGSVITLLFAALVEVLSRRRRRAERQAVRSEVVSETLQRSLLPTRLPDVDGVRLDARYQPATAGISVGGDWYDAVVVGAKLYFSVGDVAGHGLEAATLMGRLRTAMVAYMADGDSPDDILAKLARLVDVADDGHFATVVCGWVDPVSGEMALANAGHPRPIVIGDGRCEVLDGDLGPPVGIGQSFELTRGRLAPGATLVAYTDGLIERRGETITDGIDRLCRAATGELPFDQLLDHLLTSLTPAGSGDDIAVLAIRRAP